jgi:hypothetical protein
MEMSQGNLLYSYLKQTKCHFLSFTNQRTVGKNMSYPERGLYQWEGGGFGENV